MTASTLRRVLDISIESFSQKGCFLRDPDASDCAVVGRMCRAGYSPAPDCQYADPGRRAAGVDLPAVGGVDVAGCAPQRGRPGLGFGAGADCAGLCIGPLWRGGCEVARRPGAGLQYRVPAGVADRCGHRHGGLDTYASRA